VVLDEEDVEV